MFTTPTKKYRLSPYFFSPMKLFGLAQPHCTPATPVKSHNISTESGPPPKPISCTPTRFQGPPPPRKRYGYGLRERPKAYGARDPPKPGAKVERAGPQHSLRMQRSLRLRRSGLYGPQKAGPSKPAIEGQPPKPRRDFEQLRTKVKYAGVQLKQSDLDDEDKVFFRELEKLSMHHTFTTAMAEDRDLAFRAAAFAPCRHQEREAKAKELIKKREALELEKKKKRLAELMEVERREKARKERIRLQQERNRIERQRYQERLRKQREQEVAEREKQERFRRQAHLEFEQQQARRKAPSPPSAPQASDVERMVIYEQKWEALKGDVSFLQFTQLPWPVLCDVTSPTDITTARMRKFFFHPTRPGVETHSKRDRIRTEFLRWHPDKFDGRILGKVVPEHHTVVREAAGIVARFLTQEPQDG